MNPFSQNVDPALAALEPLGVALVAMDRRMINLLELFFQNYCMKPHGSLKMRAGFRKCVISRS